MDRLTIAMVGEVRYLTRSDNAMYSASKSRYALLTAENFSFETLLSSTRSRPCRCAGSILCTNIYRGTSKRKKSRLGDKV
jgi:hypothetical protein